MNLRSFIKFFTLTQCGAVLSHKIQNNNMSPPGRLASTKVRSANRGDNKTRSGTYVRFGFNINALPKPQHNGDHLTAQQRPLFSTMVST